MLRALLLSRRHSNKLDSFNFLLLVITTGNPFFYPKCQHFIPLKSQKMPPNIIQTPRQSVFSALIF